MQKNYLAYFAAPVVVVLLIDPVTAAHGVQEGLNVCLSSVIPALFPLFFFVGCLTESLVGVNNPRFHRLLHAIGLPAGAESVFLLSLISGYPVGAQNVTNLYRKGTIDRNIAHRLMGFCNNAGPAFIFGMSVSLFQTANFAWLLWGIQIIATLIVAFVLPDKSNAVIKYEPSSRRSVPEILSNSIKSMVMVCGWVIIFRTVTTFLDQWSVDVLPTGVLVALHGILELTNGCIALKNVNQEALRFVLMSAFLSFGGLCVWLQISSVAQKLGTGMFALGKLLQTAVSTLLALTVQKVIYKNDIAKVPSVLILIVCCCAIALISFILHRKKTVAKPEYMLYNTLIDKRNEA